MKNPEIVYLTQKALELIFEISMPMILIATVLGFLVAIIQTAIQVQEQTLSFAIKLSAIVFSIFILQENITSKLVNFLNHILNNIPLLVK